MLRRSHLPFLLPILLLTLAAGPATRPAATSPAPAKRVVILLDATGSMMNRFDTVSREARKRVDMLAADQSFTLVAYSQDGTHALHPTALLPATPANKRAAYDFLDHQAPHGAGGPAAAIAAAAAKLKPDEIWLYTDGDVNDWPAVFDEVARWPARHPRVNTSLQVAAPEFQDPLILLARQTGGACLDADYKPVPADRPVKFRPTRTPPAQTPPAQKRRP